MDARMGGGAHMESAHVQEKWPLWDRSKPVNWLKLIAISLALHFCLLAFECSSVCVRADNMMAKAHVN